MSSADEVHRGGLSQAWIVRCAHCPRSHRIEHESGRVSDQEAIQWVREDGYNYFEGRGWLCPDCTQTVLEQRRRRKKKGAPPQP